MTEAVLELTQNQNTILTLQKKVICQLNNTTRLHSRQNRSTLVNKLKHASWNPWAFKASLSKKYETVEICVLFFFSFSSLCNLHRLHTPQIDLLIRRVEVCIRCCSSVQQQQQCSSSASMTRNRLEFQMCKPWYSLIQMIVGKTSHYMSCSGKARHIIRCGWAGKVNQQLGEHASWRTLEPLVCLIDFFSRFTAAELTSLQSGSLIWRYSLQLQHVAELYYNR